VYSAIMVKQADETARPGAYAGSKQVKRMCKRYRKIVRAHNVVLGELKSIVAALNTIHKTVTEYIDTQAPTDPDGVCTLSTLLGTTRVDR
jgi:hypothetical protein